MTVWYKQGVCGILLPPAQKAFGKVHDFYFARGYDLYVTAIRDGNHMAGSFHYIGLAFDFKKVVGVTEQMLKDVLGEDYDVIEHKTHFHVEYDPK